MYYSERKELLPFGVYSERKEFAPKELGANFSFQSRPLFRMDWEQILSFQSIPLFRRDWDEFFPFRVDSFSEGFCKQESKHKVTSRSP